MDTKTFSVENILKHLPGAIGCTDHNQKLIYCSESIPKIFGFKNREEALGTTPYDMRTKVVECADIFIRQNNEVMKNKLPLRILDIHPYANNEIIIFLTTKFILCDSHNHAVGVAYQATEITKHVLIKIYAGIAE